MHAQRVRALLMGGQACVLYGGAEFSRDADFAVLADTANLTRLGRALEDLQAVPIAVPPFEMKYLRRGHAVHFRCLHPEALRMRVDVLSRMRGVDPFGKLWKRRTTVRLPDGLTCEVLSLPDLVRAKKTQRDKDWPMIRRLVEAHYFSHRRTHRVAHVRFWLLELRTAELLHEVARSHPRFARLLSDRRPLLRRAGSATVAHLDAALAEEERRERAEDKAYWLPLRRELEQLRHAKD
jgi:hypothetical protein